jgi:acyl carrier protein
VDDLGADSLAIAELVLDLEATLDVDIEDEQLQHVRTVQDVIVQTEIALLRRAHADWA